VSAKDLVAFLKARLDEDEANWQREKAEGFGADTPWMVDRMLCEVEAKRAILAEHGPGYPVTYPEPSGQPTCGVCHAGGWDYEAAAWPCLTVRILAAVYSDHPDYDESWKP
jgi:hypothetical protein